MEAVLANLPEAARLAARASAAAQQLSTDSGAAAGKAPTKEPTLAELLKAQKISLTDDDDPALESMGEFFETVDDAARAEQQLQAQREAAASVAAANHAAAMAAAQKRSQPKKVDADDIEFVDEWS